jgi:hypothetical protein
MKDVRSVGTETWDDGSRHVKYSCPRCGAECYDDDLLPGSGTRKPIGCVHCQDLSQCDRCGCGVLTPEHPTYFPGSSYRLVSCAACSEDQAALLWHLI